MLVVDDLLTAPFRGLMFVFRSVHDAVREEIDDERQSLRDELNDLYMQVEIGEISEEEFERREDEILDRLEALEAMAEEIE